MSSSEESELRSFLKSCKSHLTDTSSLQTIHVVIGNEACDLDSVVSALVYAFFLFKRNGTQTTLFVPVLNIPSKKYRLATEVPFALEQHMISADLLTFRDQINLNELHREQKLLLTLVDHNVLHRDDSELASAVCKVIDHHRNQQTETSSVSCMIEPVGSCCTLVAELVLRDPDVTIPEELWSLLYATILLDTVCLSESAGRTTPKDIQHVEILEEKLGKINRKEVFEQLQAARMDVSGLSALDILRKDVKTINNHGMAVSVSSVPNSLKDLFRDRDVDAVLKEFSAHQGAAVVVIMALYLDQQREPHRELAVYSEDILLRDQLIRCLSEAVNPVLSLKEAVTISCAYTLAFVQVNVAASRKQVLPVIVDFFEGMDDPVKPSGEDKAAEEVPQARVSKNTDHSSGTESGDGNNEDLGVGVGSWSGEMMTGKQKRVQKEDVDLPDPFDHHMNILLENNLDRTTSTTPASGLSSRSYSPTNDGSESQYPSAPVHFMRHLLPEVPANSPETCHGAAMMSQGKHQELPSFHNVEMVQKIREKKLSYNCGDEEISKEVSNYPYTPTNSYTEFGHIGQTAKHCVLPNFMNADLMQRLEEKKAMLENIVHPSEGFEIFESSGLNDGHSVPMSNVSDIKSSDVSDEISEDEDFSVDVFANREHLESLSKNTSETCCKDNSTDTGTAVEDVMNDVLNTEFVQNDTEPDHNNVISPVSHIQTSEEHLTGDIQSGLVTFGDCHEVGYNMEAGLHAELPPNNVLNTSLMMADSPKSAELNAPFEEDLSDKVGALSSHGNNNTSSSNPDDTGNSAEEKIVHHTVQDTTTMLEQVDCRKVGLVIHAANEQEAATKFTESVINSAMKEYKEYCKSVGKKQARFNEQEVNLSSSHHDSSKRETERCVSENCDNVLSLQIEKSLYLGDEPGESYTDDCVNIASDVLPHGVKPCEDQTCNDGHVLVLGEEPGESRTECDTFEEHMRSRGMDVVDIDVSDRLDANVGKSDDVPKDTVLENEKAMDFVQDVIKKAIDVCIHEPDGSTAPGSKSLFQSPDGSSDAPEMKTQPKGGSTGKAKLLEELKDDTMKQKKTRKEKQRHHLQDVQKTLNISLDFSSEDEEEIKALKDQIPEQLTTADSVPAERPTTLNTTKKKIMPNLDLLNDTDIDIPVSPISTDDDIGISVDDEKTPDDLTTPDVLNNSMFDGELEWQSTSSSTPVDPIPEYTAREELEDERHWRSVQIGEKWYKIDMKVIEPYKKVLSHGGYYGDGFNAIVVFTACYLPDRRRRDYHYVMDNLFLYVISTLELLVVEDYMIVYFHGATPRHKMPSLRWLKRCYDMIDRRLRKNLKGLLIVHPTIWLKTLVFMMKPFVSSKFSSKLRYIKNLEALNNAVPTEYIYIPEEVQKYDEYWSKPRSHSSAGST